MASIFSLYIDYTHYNLVKYKQFYQNVCPNSHICDINTFGNMGDTIPQTFPCFLHHLMELWAVMME